MVSASELPGATSMLSYDVRSPSSKPLTNGGNGLRCRTKLAVIVPSEVGVIVCSCAPLSDHASNTTVRLSGVVWGEGA